MPDKIYNIALDTKRVSFNGDVRGVKQGDNNAVLNITLTQNSVPVDLTGAGVRINYKMPDGQILLQMATTTNATEGKIQINVLSKALELVGEVKAELSIFDPNNRKITSVMFSIFVDASIYTNDYIKNNDLDIVQQIWTSENARIENENLRVTNEKARATSELNRIEKENARESNENRRDTGETHRIEAENIRINNERNRVNSENNRISAETNRDTEFQIIKADYNTYKNTMIAESNVAELQSQISENKKQLDEISTKNRIDTDIIVKKTTKDLKYYVSTTGSDSNNGLAETTPFRTIAKAVSMLPQIINHNVTIMLQEGTYGEPLELQGYIGGGDIMVRGHNLQADTHVINYILLKNVNVRLNVAYAEIKNPKDNTYISVDGCTQAGLSNIKVRNQEVNTYGVISSFSNLSIYNCEISNQGCNAIWASKGSRIYVQMVNGANNKYGLYADKGAIIIKGGAVQITGNTANEKVDEGGVIR